jgi:hypothetical protein
MSPVDLDQVAEQYDGLKEKFSEATKTVKEAIASKNVFKILAAVKSLVKVAVFWTQKAAEAMEDVEGFIEGAQKKDFVTNILLGWLVPEINKAVNIWGLNEEQEEKLIRNTLDWILERAVEFGKKKGWSWSVV